MLIWLLVLQLVTVDVAKPAVSPDTWIVPAELDGQPQTREWVAWGTSGRYAGWYRAYGVRRDGSICTGPWFWPWPQTPDAFFYGYIGRAGDRDRLLIQSTDQYLEVTITPCEDRPR